MDNLARFLAIERNNGNDRKPKWQMVLGCDRLELWGMGTATEVETNTVRHVFHIAHNEAARRGARVRYLGQRFDIIQVSDSSKLIGIELLCALA